ncbi:MAG: molybdopterin molybdotransferase MoeA [Pseudomonadota bacterium]
MISVADADATIAAHCRTLDATRVPLDSAHGAVLHQAVVAERDQPPFDRVTMDGIAVRWTPQTRTFTSQGNQFAGEPPLKLQSNTSAIEIMTGAVMPSGADTVIPVERYALDAQTRTITLESGYEPERGQFVHGRGTDHPAGTVLLKPSTVLGPCDIAVVASAGLADIESYRQPRVAVIATGNELVSAGQPIAPHQIRLSNAPAMIAALQLAGINASTSHHLPDEPDVLHSRIGVLLENNDVLVLSGGVSRGKADYVPDVLTALGVEKHFHRVAQRPGKPMWFGSTPAGTLVFGLPGNPVSTLCCFQRYVMPALRRLSGIDPTRAATAERAALTCDHQFKPALTQMLPVTLDSSNGALQATPRATNTSGDFSALAGTNGFLELPAERQTFAAGETFALYRWPASL